MSIYQGWINDLSKYADLPCIDDADQCYSYTQLLTEIACWRQKLSALRISPGDVIGIRCDYSLASIAALLALFLERAIVALIPRGGDSKRYVAESHARAIIELSSDGRFEFRPLPVEGRVISPLIVRLMTECSAGFVIFTSGSTSNPKAALHSVERFVKRFRKPARRFRTIAFSTMDHIAGMDTMFHTLSSGGALILTRSRKPLDVMRLIETRSVEALPTSPSFLRTLCEAQSIHTFDCSSLKIIAYGSEPMDQRTLTRLLGMFPNRELLQKYGSTELGAPRTVSRGNGSLWLKFREPDVEVKVVDGVLWTRTPHSSLGYLNMPSTLDGEGWYCTEDMVETDGEWIRFLGRSGERINVGGEKVSPTEVEDTIRELEFVRDVLVFGETHALLGEVVAARVVVAPRDDDANRTIRQDVRNHCRSRLPLFKVPMRISVVDCIAITDRQKRRRRPMDH